MTSTEIRERFLRFFEKHGHSRVASSSVIPWGDPTLMFTNAGMNQFKDVFLGYEKREYIRATTCQKCVRAGGKHNDLDEVGRTTRHGTFLEMLGNFSFGDYFKHEAIHFAWEFMTGEMGLNPDKLYASVYSTDEDAFSIWNESVGLPPDRILRFGNIEKGDEENFWSMGTTGPCGPCSELYIDRGSAYGPDDPYKALEINSSRFLELWNLVFMQYNRHDDGTMTPLPKPSIDTGLGLERMAMVVQGKGNIFETDILGKLVNRVEGLTGKSYEEATGMSFRVAADHIRTLTFAIADGALPSNEGRGYVLRRILRRALRYLRKLDVHEPLLYRLVSDVVDLMGDAYPEVAERADYISMVIKGEEERFLKTLDQGIDLFDKLAQDVQQRHETIIAGNDAFKLYDTYGFPVDLTRIMAEEKGMTVDMAGFEQAMEEQRTRAREASTFTKVMNNGVPWVDSNVVHGETSVFIGYDHDSVEAHVVRFREVENNVIELVVDTTPFYALSGGQVNDIGTITSPEGGFVLIVNDVYDAPGVGRVHVCSLNKGNISPHNLFRDHVILTIDKERRRHIERNHTATHILQAGLQKVLGGHVRQSGSAVDSERLRFDFNHFSAMTADDIEAVEEFVNMAVIENFPVTIMQTTLEDARRIGAMSLFEDKYGEVVRVIKINDVSCELCGGTHVTATGRIGLFKIVSESSVAAGIRRIEAVTGRGAFLLARGEHRIVGSLARSLNTSIDDILERVESLNGKIRDLEKEVKRLKTKGATKGDLDIISTTVEVKGIKVLFGRITATNADELKHMADRIRETIGSGIGVVGTVIDGKASVVVTITDDIIRKDSLRAGDIVKKVAEVIGGSGGGKPHLAMAGGKDVSRLDEALSLAPVIIERFLEKK